MHDRRNTNDNSIPLSSVVRSIHATLAQFDIQPAAPAEMVEARALAETLIGDQIVRPETLARVHERSGAALFLAREEDRLTGVWAAVLLSEAGLRACHEDRFDGVEPEPEHVARKDRDPAGVYAWGIAAATRETARRLVAAGEAVDRAALAHLPAFTRPVTEAGLRLAVERRGFRLIEGSKTGLYWVDPHARLSDARLADAAA
jgi:hypothetical protein